MQPTINVDLSKALLRFSEAGIPESVRNNLRRLLPPLIHNITNTVNNRINTNLKSRKTLTVEEKMKESRWEVTGTIQITSPSAEGLLPTYLELGTQEHLIYPRGAYARFFTDGFWGWTTYTKMKPVHHKGTRAYHLLGGTVSDYKAEILSTVEQAKQGLNE